MANHQERAETRTEAYDGKIKGLAGNGNTVIGARGIRKDVILIRCYSGITIGADHVSGTIKLPSASAST